jgi:hypothetical protein
MKCEPTMARGFAMALVRAGLRARTIFFRAVVARRTREMALFAARARAMVARAGFARRTVFRTGRLACIARRVRDTVRLAAVLRFVVMRRFAAMLRLATGRRFATVRRFATGRRFATVRRFTELVRFAAAVLRAGLARRTVLRAVFADAARRVREGLFFAVRFREVLDLLNIINLPTWLKVRRG